MGLRILTAIFRYFPCGGLQRDYDAIVRECLKRGHSVTCFTEFFEGDIPEGLDIIRFHSSVWSNHLRAKAFEKGFNLYMQNNHFDLTFTFNRIGGADYYFAADDCLAENWHNKHSSFMLKLLPRYRIFLQLEDHIFNPDSRTNILYLVNRQKEQFIRWYGTQPERFFYLPPGIAPEYRLSAHRNEERLAVRKELKIPESAVVLMQAAAKFKTKGIDRSIEIAAALPDELKRKIHLLFVGDRDNQAYLHLAEKSGLAEQCTFLQPDPCLAPLYNASDLMIHPARAEAAGSVIAEALACGLPVLTSEVCGFSDLAKAAGCPVMPFEFNTTPWVEELTALLSGNLPELRKKVEAYAEHADFTRRAAAAVDILEQH